MSGFNNTIRLSFKLYLHLVKRHNRLWNKASSTRKYYTLKSNSSQFFITCVHGSYTFLGRFIQDELSFFPWQHMTQVTPAERHPYRGVSHLPAHLHIATTFCGNRFVHFVCNSVPKCSSHSCSTGSKLASRSLSVASSRHALLTRKAPRWICPLISLLVGGRASIPALELVYCFYPQLVECMSSCGRPGPCPDTYQVHIC